MLGMVSIRAAGPADAPAISRLLEQLGRTIGADELRARLAALKGDALVAELDGAVVGVLHLDVTEFLFECRGRVTAMVVADGHRGHGIGAQLLAAAEDLARDKGCESMEVTSAGHREAAHRFYATNGYVIQPHRFRKRL
jgi:GNAT superfamily N-acetyltransferase